MASEESAKRNPSLKKYFKYMLNRRELTIKFTPSKIKDIITYDLQIKFSNFSKLLQDVSVEMFMFYIQTWPGWQPDQLPQCLNNPEESYRMFRQYVKEKIQQLEGKEKLYNKPEPNDVVPTTNLTLNPPLDCDKYLPSETSKRKIKFPYCLEITGNPSAFNSLYFDSDQDRIFLSICAADVEPRVLSTVEALNHPFVSVLFKIPGLVKFSRKNVHRVEMFLCRSSDNWQFPTQDRIVDVRKYLPRSRVYTTNFLKVMFTSLMALIDKNIDKVSFYVLLVFSIYTYN